MGFTTGSTSLVTPGLRGVRCGKAPGLPARAPFLHLRRDRRAAGRARGPGPGCQELHLSRLCSLGLFGVMGMAVLFHLDEAGLEGFPFGVVEAHEYGYELAAVYAFVFLYFAVAGPGKYSLGSGDLADAPEE